MEQTMDWVKSAAPNGALYCALGALMMGMSRSINLYPMQHIVLTACAWAGIVAGLYLLLCSGLALWNLRH